MKLLFYILPGLLGIVNNLFLFITPKRIADAGGSSLAVTATLPVWAISYTLTAFLLSRFLSRQNAVRMLLLSQCILLATMLGMLTLTGVYMQYLWLALCGLGMGLFFPSFQAVVKFLGGNAGALEASVRGAAAYAFSTSAGMALGMTAATLFWGKLDPQNGWRICFWGNIAILIFTLCVICAMEKAIRRNTAKTPETPGSETTAAGALLQRPNLIVSAWILGGGGLLAMSMLRAYLPDYATKVLALTTSEQGCVMSLIGYAQAGTALACFRTKRWPYQPWAGLLSASGGIIALLLIAANGSFAACAAASVLFGIFTGTFIFNMTYHAIASVTQCARYASINETITGITCLAAPLGAGLLADCGNDLAPFTGAAIIVALALAGHAALTWKYRFFKADAERHRSVKNEF